MARYCYSCSVRWFDMDAYGHVNNVTFLRYLEEARMDFALEHAHVGGSGDENHVAVVAQHEIAYVRPLHHRSEPVTVELWFSALDDRSFTVAYEIKDHPGSTGSANALYARAETVMVPYDLSASRRRPLSAAERSLYSQYVEELADA